MSTVRNKIRKQRLHRMKTICTICNVILALSGVAAVCVGIWAWFTVFNHAVANQVFVFASDAFWVADYALVGIGGYVILMTGFGVYGLCNNSKCALFTYFFLLLLVLIVTIAFTTMSFVFSFQIKRDLSLTLRDAILQSYGRNGEDELTRSVDALQVYFGCCGEKNYTEWMHSQWYEDEKIRFYTPEERNPYPSSCCAIDPGGLMVVNQRGDIPTRLNETACYINIPNSYMNNKGCYDIIHEWMYPYVLLFGGIGGAILIVLLADLLVFIMLFRNMEFDDVDDDDRDRDRDVSDRRRNVDRELPPLDDYNDMNLDMRKSAVPAIDFSMARKWSH